MSEVETADGVKASYYESAEVSGPLTSGLRRSCILLPQDVVRMETGDLEPLLTHELVHIRNWDWVLFEEEERSLLWLHPVVHLLIDRIRHRELSVDAETVRPTGKRGQYMQTLVHAAESRHRPRWIAAPLFGGLQLKQRIETLLEDHKMTHRRMLVFAGLAPAAFMIGGRASNESFPLAAYVSPGHKVYRVGEAFRHQSYFGRSNLNTRNWLEGWTFAKGL